MLSKKASGDVVCRKLYGVEYGSILFSKRDIVGSTRRGNASYGTKSECIKEPNGEIAYKRGWL